MNKENPSSSINNKMWEPYLLGKAQRMRSLHTPEGLGDRLRFIAFAERQAFHAFHEAIERYPDAPTGLREAWKWVAQEEAKHEGWLLKRLEELGQRIDERSVSLDLYYSLQNLPDAKSFAHYISDAEERGRVGAESFYQNLKEIDPVTANIFKQIAIEEVEHINLAKKYFP